jgi:hypothetical protein
MCDEFKNYKEANFTTKLQNLLKAVEDDSEATQRDELALVNDRMIQGPQPESTQFGYPQQWYGTEAQQRLHEIIQSGMQEFMDIEDLRETRDDWKRFPLLDIFVCHIRTEEKRHRARGY